MLFKCKLVLMTLLMYVSVSAQQFSPSLVSAAGSTDRTEDIILTWSVGESAVDRHMTSQRSYTEGFQQPVITVESFGTNDERTEKGLAVTVEVAPNPVAQTLYVRAAAPQHAGYELLLFSHNGTLLESVLMSDHHQQTEIDMRAMPAGLYVLRVVSRKDTTQQIFNISKFN